MKYLLFAGAFAFVLLSCSTATWKSVIVDYDMEIIYYTLPEYGNRISARHSETISVKKMKDSVLRFVYDYKQLQDENDSIVINGDSVFKIYPSIRPTGKHVKTKLNFLSKKIVCLRQ